MSRSGFKESMREIRNTLGIGLCVGLGCVALKSMVFDADNADPEGVHRAPSSSRHSMQDTHYVPCRPGTTLQPIPIDEDGNVRVRVGNANVFVKFSPGGNGPRKVRANGQMLDGTDIPKEALKIARLGPLRVEDNSVYELTVGKTRVIVDVEQRGFHQTLAASSCLAAPGK